MLIEVDPRTRRGKSKKKFFRKKLLFERSLTPYETKLQEVPVSYRMPDLSGNCDLKKAKAMVLLYAPISWGQKNNFSVENPSDVIELVESMYSIYVNSFPDNPDWAKYIETLKNDVLKTYKQ